ncbi:MAG: RIP metalloprotease RseP [Acidobacteriia bacterium]|nr:RIP metalloprotease RseP [Terriglobia bacterium]
MVTTILAFIVVLGIVITVHEFGHFAMAKLLKIRVITFSLGFGPRLAGFTRGGTEYRVSPLPLGGYVKMAGEAFDEERQGAPDEFQSHPKWHRLLVSLAGPFMNILLAVAIVTTSYMEGVLAYRYLIGPADVGPVIYNSVAQRAGLKSKDRIVAVNGNRVNTWQSMEIALGTAPRDALNVSVDRSGQRIELHFDTPPTEDVDPISLGFNYMLPRTIVQELDPNSPAQKAGLKPGDEILSVQGGGKRGSGYDEILSIISESKGVPLQFEIRRPAVSPPPGASWESTVQELPRTSATHWLTITPIEDKGRVLVGFYAKIPADHERYGLLGSVKHAVRHNYDIAVLTMQVIGRIFTGSASVKTISGPIGIAGVAGDAARTHSARLFIGFIGLLSLNLGIFNLLPIPILDGGVIALLLIEGLIGRDLSLGIKEKIVQVGFVFLILLMGFVVINDLTKVLNFNSIFR